MVRLRAVDAELFGTMLAFFQQFTAQVEAQLAPVGLTSRQWLLLAVLTRRFPGSAPTLTEATAAFGTTRQNVRQLARQLERHGWLRIEADADDRRSQRLVLTDRVGVFDEPAMRAAQAAFVQRVFGGLTVRERRALLDMVSGCLSRMADGAPASAAAS